MTKIVRNLKPKKVMISLLATMLLTPIQLVV